MFEQNRQKEMQKESSNFMVVFKNMKSKWLYFFRKIKRRFPVILLFILVFSIAESCYSPKRNLYKQRKKYKPLPCICDK
ncbi:MAG: hypothetical protein A3H98_00340 [Bacteroidetes bacterium RIFCSPLOWO2_02_FULL_36_8]|nr:MAG: hypothetical protein A3H98_00340 [Bacteroidetes bacterium RIFCSPLOWO2_02_FULL_36_8]